MMIKETAVHKVTPGPFLYIVTCKPERIMKLVGLVMSTRGQYGGMICAVITEHIASNLETLQLNFAFANE